MHTFYLTEKINGDTVSIFDTEQLHHLRDVLRLKVGDEVVIFDIEGNEYFCVIAEVDKKRDVMGIKARKTAPIRTLKLTIACSIPKQSKMDEIVDKLTQLGVDTIIPMVTDRVIVKLEGTEQVRLERWRKIARSASEQSHRNLLPFVFPVSGLKEVLAESKRYQLKLVPTLAGERKTIRQVVADCKPASVFVLIGPEGDFTQQEIQQALEVDFIAVSLGDNVLRVETAAIAAASYIKLALEI
jgi:16S rRNA (uracil1498-N3)-methyltransferase